MSRSRRDEFDVQDDLDAFIPTATSLEGLTFQGLDFRAYAGRWLELPAHDALFLGCVLPDGARERLGRSGATVLNGHPGLPFNAFRNTLYRPDDLYSGYDPGDAASYRATLDQRIYEHWCVQGTHAPESIREALFRRLHDHSMTDALDERLERWGRNRAVAIMGGHSLSRIDPDYIAIAHLARDLQRRRFIVVTGGGPGAMEAGNLGAACGPFPDEALDATLALVQAHPRGHYDAARPRDITGKHEWLAPAWRALAQLRERGPALGESLGVPTWHYGHEPTNCFATACAKYFANSEREDGLLTIARGGIVFAPGAAGTIQEIFQDGAQNYYAAEGTASPMIFLNELFWKAQRPAYGLVAHLAAGREFGRWVLSTDSIAEAAAFLEAYRAHRAGA